ncbi:hypothetical protein F66182_920 [Fusarium sp. NRRL 66182]|nr:hypothetical protein F66182_920 [Fusarium sp. NRRL 66182]
MELTTRDLKLPKAPPESFSLSSNNYQDQISTLDIKQAQEKSRPENPARRQRLPSLFSSIQQLALRLSRRLLFKSMEDHEEDSDENAQPLQDNCIQTVTSLFPDICVDYLKSIARPLSFVPQDVINHIIQLQERGQSYKTRSRQSIGKRKRQDDENSQDAHEKELLQAKRKYIYPDRPALSKRDPGVVTIKQMIAGDFPLVPAKTIHQLLSEHGHRLLPTYLALDDLITKANAVGQLPWAYKKTPSVLPERYKRENIDDWAKRCHDMAESELIRELQTARSCQHFNSEKIRKENLAKRAELHNFEMAKATGDIADYCMSTEGCTAGFSFGERKKFLDKKLTSALDRIEQETVLGLAQLDNLAKCPFCQYAEEYPPIAVNREFRCQNPECEITSCRLCRVETHIPKTCEEAERDRGVDQRRVVEEAMSLAMIRKCNKCMPSCGPVLMANADSLAGDTPFIKESGCNKMTCTRQGCKNVQCYICSKSCDYRHFNDPNRGGKKGNCPLFDSVEERHENEVKIAEAKAKKKVLQENPNLAPGLLDLNVSESVKEDDRLRKKNDPYRRNDGWIEEAHRELHARQVAELRNAPPRRPHAVIVPAAAQNIPARPNLDLPMQDMQQQQNGPVQERLNPDVMQFEMLQDQGRWGLGINAAVPLRLLDHQEQQQMEEMARARLGARDQEVEQQAPDAEAANPQAVNQHQQRPRRRIRYLFKNAAARWHDGQGHGLQNQPVQPQGPAPLGDQIADAQAYYVPQQPAGINNLQIGNPALPQYQHNYHYFPPFGFLPPMQEQQQDMGGAGKNPGPLPNIHPGNHDYID